MRQKACPTVYGHGDRTCERAAYDAQCMAELVRARQQCMACLYLDVEKFLEHISHSQLLQAAEEEGVPVRLVQCAVIAYRGAR
eukprot:431081-Amphidinium_carterae.1